MGGDPRGRRDRLQPHGRVRPGQSGLAGRPPAAAPAEEALLSERKPPAMVRAFFATAKPASAPGKFALALALRADGYEGDAAEMVRDLWRTESFGRSLEAKVLDAFPRRSPGSITATGWSGRS